MFQNILTDRLCIRRLLPEDAGNMFAYRSKPEVTQYQSWEPQALEDVQPFIDSMSIREFGTHGWYQIGIALSDDGCLIGDGGIRVLESDSRIAEIAVTIAPAFQSKGYATDDLRRGDMQRG